MPQNQGPHPAFPAPTQNSPSVILTDHLLVAGRWGPAVQAGEGIANKKAVTLWPGSLDMTGLQPCPISNQAETGDISTTQLEP